MTEDQARDIAGRQIVAVRRTEGRPDILTLDLSGGFTCEIVAYKFESSFHSGSASDRTVAALKVDVKRS